MKTKLLILFLAIFLFAFNLFVQADWIRLGSSENFNINNIKFLNANTGIAVCRYGEVLKTTNAGMNWFLKNSGHTSPLQDICFVNQQIVLAVGLQGGIIRSTDCGENWVTIDSPNNTWLNSISFVDNLTGFVCGDDEISIKTTDAGLTWTLKSMGTGNFFNCWFFNSNTGVVSNTTLGMRKTTNGGSNWLTTYNPVDFAKGIYFINQNLGFAVGKYGYILKTTNSGDNWFVIQPSNNIYNLDYISFLNQSIGLATGGSQTIENRGVVLKTTNGGDNWVVTDNINSYIHGIAFNGTYAFIAADSGIYRSADPIGIKNISSEVPKNYFLSQNYPNPFNPETIIQYELQKNEFVKLYILNSLGQKVATLVNEKQSFGTYEVTFDGTNLPSGIYFYKLETASYNETKKMILLK